MISDLSIIIPAYNESKRIGHTLQLLTDFARKEPLVTEIIVVSDGSTDETVSIVEQFPTVHLFVMPQNKGKFAAFAEGVRRSEAEWILLYDADSATPIEEIYSLLPYTDASTCIIGSRAVADALIERSQSSLRVFLGRTGNRLIRAVTGLPFSDTQCGFKLLRADVAKRIVAEMKIERFGGDVELLYLAQKMGAQIKEVGVRWRDVPVSTVRLRDYIRTAWDLLRIRLNSKKYRS